MNGVRRVPVRYLALLCDSLQEDGVDTAALLRRAGIDARAFDRHGAALGPLEMEAFVASASRLTGRSDLGFELGLRIRMTSHDLLGYGMLSCRNFDELMRLVARHYHLMTETFSLRYLRGTPTGAGDAIYTPALTMSAQVLHFYLEALAVAHDKQLRQVLPGGADMAYDIHLSMPPPPHLSRYQALAPTRYHFDEGSPPGVRVVMGAHVLDHPLPFADLRMAQEVERRCGDMARRLRPTSQDWAAYLRTVLRYREGESITLDSIARFNRVSPRTIERHLRRENLSFRELSRQVRLERACELLRHSSLPVAQIAHQLGFSDAANFSRAFRRALGLAPLAYRQGTQDQQAHDALALVEDGPASGRHLHAAQQTSRPEARNPPGRVS